MIHDEICSFKLSKLAKEKGFYLHSTPFYALENFTAEYVDDAGDFYEVDFEKGELYLNYPIKGVLHKEKMLPAPTQSLLQRWLREKKGIVVEVMCLPTTRTSSKYEYKRHVFWGSDGHYIEGEYGDDIFDTYELALEDVLKFALENLG